MPQNCDARFLDISQNYSRVISPVGKITRTIADHEQGGSLSSEDLGHLELLMLRLPELVGSPLSINAVREDLRQMATPPVIYN
jgi:hypothetical protein